MSQAGLVRSFQISSLLLVALLFQYGSVGSAATIDTGPVTALAIAPDGTEIAIGRPTGETVIIDLASRVETRVPHEESAESLVSVPSALRFSADGSRLAIGTADGLITVFDRNRGQSPFTLLVHDNAIVDIQFFPNGEQLLSIDSSGQLKVRSTREGILAVNQPAITANVHRALILNDGRDLAVAASGSLHFIADWQSDGPDVVRRAVGIGAVQSLLALPRGADADHLLLIGRNGTVVRFDASLKVIAVDENVLLPNVLHVGLLDGQTLLAIARESIELRSPSDLSVRSMEVPDEDLKFAAQSTGSSVVAVANAAQITLRTPGDGSLGVDLIGQLEARVARLRSLAQELDTAVRTFQTTVETFVQDEQDTPDVPALFWDRVERDRTRTVNRAGSLSHRVGETVQQLETVIAQNDITLASRLVRQVKEIEESVIQWTSRWSAEGARLYLHQRMEDHTRHMNYANHERDDEYIRRMIHDLHQREAEIRSELEEIDRQLKTPQTQQRTELLVAERVRHLLALLQLVQERIEFNRYIASMTSSSLRDFSFEPTMVPQDTPTASPGGDGGAPTASVPTPGRTSSVQFIQRPSLPIYSASPKSSSGSAPLPTVPPQASASTSAGRVRQIEQPTLIPHDGLFVRRNSRFGRRTTDDIEASIAAGRLPRLDNFRFDEFLDRDFESIPKPEGSAALALSHGLAQIPKSIRVSGGPTHFLEIALRARTEPQAETRDFESPEAHLLIVLDVSGSMGGAKLTLAKDILIELIEGMRAGSPRDVLGIVVFNEGVQAILPATRVSDLALQDINTRLNRLAAGGGTDINLALLSALPEFDSFPAAMASRRIYLLTDGNPTSGISDWPSIRSNFDSAMREQGLGTGRESVSLSTLAFQSNDVNDEELSRLAGLTGGSSSRLDTADDFERVLVGDLTRRHHLAAMNIQLRLVIDRQIAIHTFFGHDEVRDERTAAEMLQRIDDQKKIIGPDIFPADVKNLVENDTGIRLYLPDMAYGETYFMALELALPEEIEFPTLGSIETHYADVAQRKFETLGLELKQEGLIPPSVVIGHAAELGTSEVVYGTLADLTPQTMAHMSDRIVRHRARLKRIFNEVPESYLADEIVAMGKLIALARNIGTVPSPSDQNRVFAQAQSLMSLYSDTWGGYQQIAFVPSGTFLLPGQ